MKTNIVCILAMLLMLNTAAFSQDTTGIETLTMKKDIALQKKDTNDIAIAYNNLGRYYFQKNNDLCLTMFDSAAIYYNKMNKLSDLALCQQDMAFGYDEIKKDSLQAIVYAERSLNTWAKLSDTGKVANMAKYLGYLYGKARKFDKAKQHIKDAIEKFEAINFEPGMAVSEYDLATVYDNQNMPDSAIYWANKSKEYWVKNDVKIRAFGTNNFLLSVFLKKNDLAGAKKYLEENRKIESETELHWKMLMEFYSHSIQLNKELKNNSMVEEDRSKYENKKRELAKEGIKVDSRKEIIFEKKSDKRK